MKIYTKGGDKGMTSLIGGKRVRKDSIRLESYGTVDELNSWLGMIRSYPTDLQTGQELVAIQSRLFDLGGNLATDPDDSPAGMRLEIKDEDIDLLEKAIDRMDAEIPPMKYFVLPGGSPASACCHMARTVCRRAERRILTLSEESRVDANVLKYINRLSDYLFVLARRTALSEGTEEMKWIPRQE